MDTNTTTAPAAAITSGSAYRKIRDAGHPWHAPSGAVVLVRDLDLTDHAVIDKFPDHLRRMVYASIEKSATLAIKGEASEVDPFEGLSGEELVKAEAEMGLAMCRLGWVKPRIVDKPEDELDDDEIRPEHVTTADRRAFSEHVYGGAQAAAATLAPFPQRQVEGVGTGQPMQAVQPASVEGDAVAGIRDTRPDSV